MTQHNKAERQLYVGNIPLDISGDKLSGILNEKLMKMGKEVGIF